jgi:mxaJ protein
MRIGVQMIGDDFSNTPPAHALTRRGIVENVRGYMVYGDYAHADPQARIVNAVAKGEIDVAFVWGPVGGYFANRQSRPLHVQPITSDQKERLVFAIAMGTRRKEQGLQTDLNRLLRENHAKITGLLARFNVPMTALPEASAEKAD